PSRSGWPFRRPGGGCKSACYAAPAAATLRPVGASVTLTAPAVAVEPGSEATLEFRLRNTGAVVDEFTLGILGDAAGWAAVVPPPADDLALPGRRRDRPGRLPPAAQRERSCRPHAVRAPRGLARGPRGLLGRGGDGPGRPVHGPVRGAGPQDVSRQPVGEPRA